jgi:hypothetical protein
MPDFIQLELIADPDQLSENALQYLEDNVEGYVARPAAVETVLLEAAAFMSAEIVDQASEVDPAVFAYYGESLVGVPRNDATPATGIATFEVDASEIPVFVPAGTLLSVPSPTGSLVVFETREDFTMPPEGGQFDSAILAQDPGEVGNGAFGDAELIELISGVSSVTVSSATTGGVEEEDADAYLDRLTTALTLLSPRPILPEDFAKLTQQDPRVGRAMAIDLFQPPASLGGVKSADATWGAEPNGATNIPRAVTVVVTALDGTALDPDTMQDLVDDLDARRELNFLVYVIPPNISANAIDVRFSLKPSTGYDFDTARDGADAALREWLNPATWGSAEPQARADSWTIDRTVRFTEVIDYANRGDGVWWVTGVQTKFSTQDDTHWGTSDLTLVGPAPLASAGTITITEAT